MSDAPASSAGPLRPLLPLILFLSMAGPLTLNILQPSLPGLEKSLGAPHATVQLTLSLYVLGMAMAQLFGGPLADRYGRRPVLIASLTLFVGASLAGMQAGGIGTLIAARVAQAMGATVCLGLSRTIIADLTDRATTARLIAYVTMVMVLAPMASPNIGSFLDTRFGWRSIFVFCTVFAGALWLAVVFTLPETRPQQARGARFADVWQRTLALVRNRVFMRYALLSALASCCFFAILGASPSLVIERMGRTPAEFGLWFILLGIGYSFGNFVTGRFTRVIGIDRMAAFGNLVQLTGVLIMTALALVPVMHPAALFIPAVLVTFGNGLVLPNVMAAGIQTDRNAAGAASGLMGFTQMILSAGASYIVAFLPNATTLPLSLLLIGFSVSAQIMLPFRFSRQSD